MTLSEILASVKEVATTGTQAYDAVVQTQTDKMTEKAAVASPKPSVTTTTANITNMPTAKPWYKAAWVIPSAIGAVILVVVVIFLRRRKR